MDINKDADILDDEDDKELDDILNNAGKEEVKEAENKKEAPKEGEQKQTYKLGTKEYSTFEEFNNAVQEMQVRNGKLASKLGELGYDPKTMTPKQKKEAEEAIKNDDKKEKEFGLSDYHKFKAIDFQATFPESVNYAEEISILVKKENCQVNGKPSYAMAYARALVANSQAVPERLANLIRTERGESLEGGNKSSINSQKKIMKSGGTSGEIVEQLSYKSQDDIDSISDFAKML